MQDPETTEPVAGIVAATIVEPLIPQAELRFAHDHFSKMNKKDFAASLESHANAVRAIPGTPFPLAMVFEDAARRITNGKLDKDVEPNHVQAMSDEDFTNEVGKYAQLAEAKPDTPESVPLVLNEAYTRLGGKPRPPHPEHPDNKPDKPDKPEQLAAAEEEEFVYDDSDDDDDDDEPTSKPKSKKK